MDVGHTRTRSTCDDKHATTLGVDPLRQNKTQKKKKTEEEEVSTPSVDRCCLESISWTRSKLENNMGFQKKKK